MVKLFGTSISKTKGPEKQFVFAGLALFAWALSLLAVFQDFLQSTDNNSAFYFSESLLFRSFWLLSLPTVLVQMKLLQNQLQNRPIAKLLTSIGVAILIHLLLFSGLVHLLSALLFDHTYTFGRVFYYSITEDLYKCVLIYSIVGGAYWYWPVAKPEKPTQVSTLTIQNGRQYTTLAVQDISYIQSSSPYILIHAARKQYLHASSLRAVLNDLDEAQFVRIHKSTIVNLREVAAYQSRLNGDYDVQLKDGTLLRLSRNYVPGFRKHLSLS